MKNLQISLCFLLSIRRSDEPYLSSKSFLWSCRYLMNRHSSKTLPLFCSRFLTWKGLISWREITIVLWYMAKSKLNHLQCTTPQRSLMKLLIRIYNIPRLLPITFNSVAVSFKRWKLTLCCHLPNWSICLHLQLLGCLSKENPFGNARVQFKVTRFVQIISNHSNESLAIYHSMFLQPIIHCCIGVEYEISLKMKLHKINPIMSLKRQHRVSLIYHNSLIQC